MYDKKAYDRAHWKAYMSIPENRQKNRERLRKYHFLSKGNPEYMLRKARNQRDSRYRAKLEAFTHYSVKGVIVCMRCGYSDIRALTLDHMGNNGLEHKKTINAKHPRQVTGTLVYRDLKKKGWPEGYQILCYNCNWIKYMEYIGYEIPTP